MILDLITAYFAYLIVNILCISTFVAVLLFCDSNIIFTYILLFCVIITFNIFKGIINETNSKFRY